MNNKNIPKKILYWYDNNKRFLPWRKKVSKKKQEYFTLVSEFMLQQTQVTTVKEYYNRWIKRFPTIQDVADSSIDEILKYWEGLGYYSRARNFHHACKTVVLNGGTIPNNVKEFQELKGVGPYIAAAVQSIAFNIPVRVGFNPTFSIKISEFGTIDAAIIQKDAELMSPGINIL